jgi:hypothetical protein
MSVRRLLKADPAAASRLSEVEIASALVRRAREGAFTVKERDRALASLADDFATLIIVEFTSEITTNARASCSAIAFGPATPYNSRAASICNVR